MAAALRANGIDAKAVKGDATFFDADEGAEVTDFHSWVQVGDRILDPKAELLRIMGAPHWRYWDYEPDIPRSKTKK